MPQNLATKRKHVIAPIPENTYCKEFQLLVNQNDKRLRDLLTVFNFGYLSANKIPEFTLWSVRWTSCICYLTKRYTFITSCMVKPYDCSTDHTEIASRMIGNAY